MICPLNIQAYYADVPYSFECPFVGMMGKERIREISHLALHLQEKPIHAFLANVPFHLLEKSKKDDLKQFQAVFHRSEKCEKQSNERTYILHLCKSNHLHITYDLLEKKIVSLSLPTMDECHCLKLLAKEYSMNLDYVDCPRSLTGKMHRDECSKIRKISNN